MRQNPECYIVACFDDISTKQQYEIIAERYPGVQGLVVIQDIPPIHKPVHNALRTRSY